MARKLVAYFSATGTTARAAERLAREVGAKRYEIRPARPYMQADLNWNDRRSRSSVEMNDARSRPALADTDAPVEDCTVVYLGFPIWWGTAPRIVSAFLEAYDFTGKTIVVWATSGGSGLGRTVANLKASAPGAIFITGGMANGGNVATIASKA